MVRLKLKEALESKSLSKRKFAKMLGIQYAGVFAYFRPGYDPRLSTIAKWAKVLDLKVRDLIAEEPSRKKHMS